MTSCLGSQSKGTPPTHPNHKSSWERGIDLLSNEKGFMMIFILQQTPLDFKLQSIVDMVRHLTSQQSLRLRSPWFLGWTRKKSSRDVLINFGILWQKCVRIYSSNRKWAAKATDEADWNWKGQVLLEIHTMQKINLKLKLPLLNKNLTSLPNSY